MRSRTCRGRHECRSRDLRSAVTVRRWVQDSRALASHGRERDGAKGTFLVGMGESFDESKLQTMNVGSFLMVPKEMRHFAMSKGETIVQVHAMGPFKVNWVNPSEVDPPDAPAAKPKS